MTRAYALSLFYVSLSNVSQRFLGNLCTTSWTRSWSRTNAYQRALFSSTPWSGRDRCGFFFTWYLKIYVISTLAFTMPPALFPTLKSHGCKSNLFLLCYFAVCSWVTPRTSPAHRVHLLCCWCSSCFQHYCDTDPEIVSLWIHSGATWLEDFSKVVTKKTGIRSNRSLTDEL